MLFPRLESLEVVGSANLHVGFDPPGCGNVYFGPGGDEYRKEVEKEGQEANEKVLKMVGDAFYGKPLKTVNIGGNKAEILRDESGKFKGGKWIDEECDYEF